MFKAVYGKLHKFLIPHGKQNYIYELGLKLNYVNLALFTKHFLFRLILMKGFWIL